MHDGRVIVGLAFVAGIVVAEQVPARAARPDETVQRMARDHWEMTRELFPEMGWEGFWALVQKELTSAQRRENADTAFLEALTTHYGDLAFAAPDTAGYEKTSCLQSLLTEQRGNCVAFCLLFYLHCIDKGITCRILATPKHAYLYLEGAGAIYDTVEGGELLDKEKSARVQKNPHAILQGQQIHSLVAFNIGTSLSKQGQLETGTRYLAQARSLGFPFSNARDNLALNYHRLGRNEDLVELLKQEDFAGDAALERMYLDALLATGQRKAALDLAGSIVRRDGKAYDVYRVFMELRDAESKK